MLLLLSLLSLPLRGSWAQQPGYWLQVERQVTVQEGLCILVPCSFSYPSDGWDSDPVYGYWFKEGAEVEKGSPVATNNPNRNVWWHTQDRFQLVGKPLEKNCALLIRAAWWSDGGTYFFRVETGKKVKYSFKTERLTLEVTDLTQRPDIFVPDTLEPGQPVTVLCVFNWSSKQCPVPAISWAAPALDSKETRPADAPYIMLSLTPRPQDQDAELTCRVDFSRSSRSSERTVRLRVAYPPKHLVVSISHDSGPAPDTQGNGSRVEAQKGQLLRLLCAADSRPPATLTWDLEGRVLARSPPSGPRTLELELPRVRPGDAGRYTCRAENRLGSQHSSLELSVQYPPEDLRVTVSQANRTVLEILGNGTSLPMMEGQSLRLVCATHSSPPAKLSWAWGTQPLSLSWSSAPGVLELPRVQMEHEGEVTCHAENPLGTRSVSLSLSVHYAPQLLGPWCSWEAEGLRCSCSSRARPAPSLHWRLGEELLEGNSSNASFTVSSSRAGPWANSSLSLHGGLSSSLRLSCEAGNEHGAQSTTVLLLPDRTPISAALSKGVFVGIGGTALLSLGLVLILVKALRTSRAQAEALRPKLSRRSTILDYINVIPKARPLARNQKAKPSSPSQIPSPETRTPVPKKNQKEQHWVSLGCPEPKTFTGKADSEISPEGLHYATLNFPGPRPRESQQPTDTHEDYAEIQFYPGPRRP
ncbi:sialic acid-binding Ig-like lectin 10 isoform X1 [Fukomys damarensis]|uniref:sialic acid-binding Ig-like lectin 10 isoform X1 n=1 Tax=Fukomys damarensis TaxID=885580 RepID=UPI0014550D61|nr:sialic acid-binding Ig-like lectin 10 isoform X1 [Fukomys damarensis]XP_033621802.1 sialic acid-binding Ig-like lectin 10 isoform X1 [Fukomys damarensis]